MTRTALRVRVSLVVKSGKRSEIRQCLERRKAGLLLGA
jgi:hypothetical protein